jgi:hypothetical protein
MFPTLRKPFLAPKAQLNTLANSSDGSCDVQTTGDIINFELVEKAAVNTYKFACFTLALPCPDHETNLPIRMDDLYSVSADVPCFGRRPKPVEKAEC